MDYDSPVYDRPPPNCSQPIRRLPIFQKSPLTNKQPFPIFDQMTILCNERKIGKSIQTKFPFIH